MIKHLEWCPRCKEQSVTIKCYERTNEIKRVEFCINRSCGYKLDLPAITLNEKGVLK